MLRVYTYYIQMCVQPFTIFNIYYGSRPPDKSRAAPSSFNSSSRPYITLQLGEFSSRVSRIFAYVGCVALLSVVIAALPVLFCLNRLPVGYGNHRKSERRRRILRCIKAWRAWLYPLHPRQEESSSASLRPSFTKYLVYQRKEKYQVHSFDRRRVTVSLL